MKRKYSERMKNCETIKRRKLEFSHRGITRSTYTAPWNDDVFMGTMHILQIYGKIGYPLTDKQIGDLIFWGDKAVKNVRLLKLRHSAAHSWIQRIKQGKREYNLLDRGKCDINLQELCDIIDDSYYQNKFGPNKPEAIIGKHLNIIAPSKWKYTGDQRASHKVGRRTPDFTHVDYKAVVEHLGLYYHSEKFTDVPNDVHEADKTKEYDKLNYMSLMIWEDEILDEKTLAVKLENFNRKVIDNAIQNIQPLAL